VSRQRVHEANEQALDTQLATTGIRSINPKAASKECVRQETNDLATVTPITATLLA